MEMLRSHRRDKHEFCLTVIKFKHVCSCPSYDITWVVLPKRDMPVGAGQAGVSKQQSEKMI